MTFNQITWLLVGLNVYGVLWLLARLFAPTVATRFVLTLGDPMASAYSIGDTTTLSAQSVDDAGLPRPFSGTPTFAADVPDAVEITPDPIDPASATPYTVSAKLKFLKEGKVTVSVSGLRGGPDPAAITGSTATEVDTVATHFEVVLGDPLPARPA